VRAWSVALLRSASCSRTPLKNNLAPYRAAHTRCREKDILIMPRTVESIVESHRVASARRAAGKPIWDVKVPLKALLAEYAGFGDDLTAEQAVDMSHRLHALLKMCVPEAWRQYEHDNYSMDFEDLMERFELAAAVDFAPTEDCTDTPCEIINWWLEELYDWGDRYRVWLG